MKRSRLQETSMEVTVGAFMFMILLALGFFTIVLSRQNIFSPSYKIDVVFENVKGLREGDNVFVRGVSIGKIKTLQIKPDGVHVNVNLEQPVELHEDYAIEILPSSVLGGRYLNIYEGSHSTPMISKGAVVIGLTPVDLIDEATKTIQIVKKALEEGKIIENLKSTMAQLNDVTAKLSKGEGTIGKLMTDDQVYNDLHEITANLKDISDRAAHGRGTIGKLLSEDDALYTNLTAAAESIRNISASIEKGDGTLGKLIKDDKLYEEVTLTLHEARAAIDDFREAAPITTFSSIFFGAF
jgi:phospholipid/cholesterol/gamma-HCH transport system substrate-binding protein